MSITVFQPKEDHKRVNDLINRVVNIIRSDNFLPYFDFFDEDALWMMPNNFKDIPVEEAKKFYRFTEKFRFDQQITTDEIVVTGDWAYVRISFDGYLRAKNDSTAPPMRSVSRHIWILKKQPDGEWKIFRDIWNNPKAQ